MPNYQGKEITATLQANTKAQLDKLISGLNRYARSNGLERVKVLSKGKDPDGGYKAIIEAHNWNPFKATKEKWMMRPTPEEKVEARKRKEAIAEENFQMDMRKLQRKAIKADRKNAIAKTKRDTVQIKAQTKAIKQKPKGKGTGLGSLFTEFIKAEPPKKARPKANKRKSQAQPRMVTLRMN